MKEKPPTRPGAKAGAGLKVDEKGKGGSMDALKKIKGGKSPAKRGALGGKKNA